MLSVSLLLSILSDDLSSIECAIEYFFVFSVCVSCACKCGVASVCVSDVGLRKCVECVGVC